MRCFGIFLALYLSVPVFSQGLVREYIPFFVFPGDSIAGIRSYILVDGGLLDETLPGEVFVLVNTGEVLPLGTMKVTGRNSRGEILLIPGPDMDSVPLSPADQYFTVLELELPYTVHEHWLLAHLRTGILYFDGEDRLLAGYELLPYRAHAALHDSLDKRLEALVKPYSATSDTGMVVTRGWFAGRELRTALAEMDRGLWELYAAHKQEQAATGMEVVSLPEDLGRWIVQGAQAPAALWISYLLQGDRRHIARHPGIADDAIISALLDMLEKEGPGNKNPGNPRLHDLLYTLPDIMKKKGTLSAAQVRLIRLYANALRIRSAGKTDRPGKMLRKLMAGDTEEKGMDALTARSCLLLMDIYNRDGEPGKIISLAEGLPVASIYPYSDVNPNDVLVLETAADMAAENGYYEEALTFYSRANDHLGRRQEGNHRERMAYNYQLMACIARKTGKRRMEKDCLEKQYRLLEPEE